MNAAQGEVETFIPNREIAPPILDYHLFRRDPALSELLREILGQPLTPKPGIDLFFFAFVRRKHQRTEFNLGLHDFFAQLLRFTHLRHANQRTLSPAVRPLGTGGAPGSTRGAETGGFESPAGRKTRSR